MRNTTYVKNFNFNITISRGFLIGWNVKYRIKYLYCRISRESKTYNQASVILFFSLKMYYETDLFRRFALRGFELVFKDIDSEHKMLKSEFHLPKKFFIICFNDSPSKVMKSSFHFILKGLFVHNIFKFLSWLFCHVEKSNLIRKIRFILKLMTSQPG